jgi:hypothetical protein
MDEAVYNILILVGYVAFSYLLNWAVDKAWWAYVDWYLRKSKKQDRDDGLPKARPGKGSVGEPDCKALGVPNPGYS